ncbi:MAG: hypothetical protein AAB909_02115 [Patescibacteria group bacterium]
MINFFEGGNRSDVKTEQIRKVVLRTSTLVLLVYLCVVVGIFGLWWYWSTKEKQLTAEGLRLAKEIESLSGVEELVGELDSRAKFAHDFLRGQEKMSKHIELIYSLGVGVEKWEYDVGGLQTLSVVVDSSSQAEQVVGSLLESYQNVTLQSLSKQKENGFLAVIAYSAFR